MSVHTRVQFYKYPEIKSKGDDESPPDRDILQRCCTSESQATTTIGEMENAARIRALESSIRSLSRIRG
jgi:hypothetical protein